MRRIFGRMRDEVTGDWRKLRNEGLHKMYCPRNIIRTVKPRRIAMGGAYGTHGEDEERVQIFGWNC